MEITYAGRWLIYSWSRFDANRNNALIHPEDLADAEQNGIGLSACIGEVSGYLVLGRIRNGTIRVRAEGVFRFLPTPEFQVGSLVREVARPEIQGTVYDLIWHDKDLGYKYFLIVNGKQKSRRYGAQELQSL